MKNWFNNLSVNKQRAISVALVVIGLIVFVVSLDYLILLVIAIPLFIIGLLLLLYIEKKLKNKKDKDIAKKHIINYESQEKRQNAPIVEKNNFNEKYLIPEGKEVYDYRIVETRVRGVFYNDIDIHDIDKGDEVAIQHNPSPDYQESTEIILIYDKTQLGHLMKEMAMEFVEKYGEHYCFIGKIIDYKRDEYEEEKLSNIIIQFKVPKFRKIINKQ